MYLSVNSILIRPVIPPTRTHPPFQLRNSAFICLQHLGRWRIGAALRWKKRLPVLEGWEQQGIVAGYFPERSLDEKSATDLAIDMI